MQDYTIDKVAWHTSVNANPEPTEHISERFWILANLPQQNRLDVHHLASSVDEIGEEFEIRHSDLTPVGQTLIRRVCDEWLRSIDRGQNPTDRLLKTELSKLTSNE